MSKKLFTAVLFGRFRWPASVARSRSLWRTRRISRHECIFSGTKRKPEDYGGISFTALLLAAYGHRVCELGNFAFGKYDPETKKETFPEVNFVRFAVPRLRYEQQDLAHVAESVTHLYQNKDMIPAVNVVYGRELPLRHFKARFEFANR